MQENTTLKILFLITKSNFGGAQRYVYDLATSLQLLGHNVAVAYGGEGSLGEKLRGKEVRTISLPKLGRDVKFLADISSFLQLYRLIRFERPDILHLNSSKVGALGALAGRISNGIEFWKKLFGRSSHRTTIIFTGHGWAFNEERSDLERFLIGVIHWCTIHLSHHTIAVSERTKENIAAIPLTKQKIGVIHNGITDMTMRSRSGALTEITTGTAWEGKGFEPNALIVGSVAELHKNKGLRYAIDAIAQLQKQVDIPVYFIVLGSDGGEHGNLTAQITALGISTHVLLAGYKQDATTLLHAFDVFVLPSITEAFPYSILEAGTAGLPIIATSVGGIPEIIDDMESGILIHSRNSAEISRALKFLIENPKRMEDFGLAIQHRIQHRYTKEEMVRKTLDCYRAHLKV